MPTLYQTKEDKPRFGTMLTKNSKGKMVLEMKGKDGEVEAFNPADIEEVMPYTIQLTRFVGGNETDPQKRDYELTEGTLSLGDVVVQLSTGSLWEVTATDSKCRSPSNSKNGFFKLNGNRL